MPKLSDYFDYNATTPLLPEVSERLKKSLSFYGNPSSLHQAGRESREALEQARECVAGSIQAQPHQLIFTSSGSEGNNQVLRHMLYLKDVLKQDVHIVTTAIEHSSLRKTALNLHAYGIDVDIISPNAKGQITVEAVEAALKPHTRLVSVMIANNETGVINPISEIAKTVKAHGALMHTDAVQGWGKLAIDVTDLGVDFLTLSGHKIYAPKGIGALYVRDDHDLTALIQGSVHERSLRSGTENLLGAIGLGEAASHVSPQIYEAVVAPLRTLIINRLSTVTDTIFFSDESLSVPNTICVSFKGVEGHPLAIRLDLEGFAVSTGPACSVGSVEPSPTLEAMGVDDAMNKGMIRISLGRFNTETSTNAFCDTLIACVADLRTL